MTNVRCEARKPSVWPIGSGVNVSAIAPRFGSEIVSQSTAASESVLAKKADASAKDAREVELERIARLRAENRHEEADKALTEFRRVNPDYKIPDPLWERVKAR